jgi:phosphatidylglycerol:prolipoprotein diacylglycerol transferase
LHPVLVKLGAFELRSYGLMLAISFLLGILLVIRRAKGKDISPNLVMDLSVLIIISAIVGSRVLYVLFHLDEFRGHWTDTFNPFQSNGQIGIAGLTMLGGVILCFISAAIFLKIKKMSFLKIADVFIPAVGLGLFLTRIGCYLNGCCFGLPCHGSLCVVFPPESAAGNTFQGIPIVPTQLYSSAYGLIILLFLLKAEKWQRYDGFLLYWFLILYGMGRFVIDFFRYYESSMVVVQIAGKGISLNQVLSLAFVLLGIIMMLINRQKAKKQPAF